MVLKERRETSQWARRCTKPSAFFQPPYRKQPSSREASQQTSSFDKTTSQLTGECAQKSHFIHCIVYVVYVYTHKTSIYLSLMRSSRSQGPYVCVPVICFPRFPKMLSNPKSTS